MFTGIVRDVGRIRSREPSEPEGSRFLIRVSEQGPYRSRDWEEGESVAVEGVCLTVAQPVDGGFWADVSEETLERTTLRFRTEGDGVNLEPALRVGDSMGGHFVTGHVDDVVEIAQWMPRGDYFDLTVRFDESYRPLIARKGSVTLDGISLTVNDVTPDTCTIRIVPHTRRNTTLQSRESGDRMNLEVDMLSRYVYNYFSQKTPEDALDPSEWFD